MFQMARGVCVACPKRVSFGKIPRHTQEVNEVCYKTVYQPLGSRSSIYSPYSSNVIQNIEEEPPSTESYQTVSSSGVRNTFAYK